MKEDRERVRALLLDTIVLLCKNGLNYDKALKVEGVIGITIDDDEVFLAHINDKYNKFDSEKDNSAVDVPLPEQGSTVRKKQKDFDAIPFVDSEIENVQSARRSRKDSNIDRDTSPVLYQQNLPNRDASCNTADNYPQQLEKFDQMKSESEQDSIFVEDYGTMDESMGDELNEELSNPDASYTDLPCGNEMELKPNEQLSDAWTQPHYQSSTMPNVKIEKENFHERQQDCFNPETSSHPTFGSREHHHPSFDHSLYETSPIQPQYQKHDGVLPSHEESRIQTPGFSKRARFGRGFSAIASSSVNRSKSGHWKMVARFVCEFPGCENSFSNKQNLLRHQTQKHGRQKQHRQSRSFTSGSLDLGYSDDPCTQDLYMN